MDKYVIVLAAGKGTSMNSIDPETSKEKGINEDGELIFKKDGL